MDILKIKELLRYDHEDGCFYWVVSRKGRVVPGSLAGSLHPGKYISINVLGKKYLAHRLAWAFHYGEWPSLDIDHINRVKTDNRISNLRLTTDILNQQNIDRARKGNKSGFLGVYPEKNRWAAKIVINGKPKWIGYFNDPQSAHEAYLAVKRAAHEFCGI